MSRVFYLLIFLIFISCLDISENDKESYNSKYTKSINNIHLKSKSLCLLDLEEKRILYDFKKKEIIFSYKLHEKFFEDFLVGSKFYYLVKKNKEDFLYNLYSINDKKVIFKNLSKQNSLFFTLEDLPSLKIDKNIYPIIKKDNRTIYYDQKWNELFRVDGRGYFFQENEGVTKIMRLSLQEGFKTYLIDRKGERMTNTKLLLADYYFVNGLAIANFNRLIDKKLSILYTYTNKLFYMTSFSEKFVILSDKKGEKTLVFNYKKGNKVTEFEGVLLHSPIINGILKDANAYLYSVFKLINNVKVKKYGYMNSNFEVIIPVEYDFASLFYKGKALVRKDKKYFIINKYGNREHNLGEVKIFEFSNSDFWGEFIVRENGFLIVRDFNNKIVGKIKTKKSKRKDFFSYENIKTQRGIPHIYIFKEAVFSSEEGVNRREKSSYKWHYLNTKIGEQGEIKLEEVLKNLEDNL